MLHFIIGTRAQLIKVAPLMAGCLKRGIPYRFVFLAQHKETIGEIIGAFGVKRPDLTLGDTGEEQSNFRALLQWTARILAEGIKKRSLLFGNDPNGVAIVHGDALPAIVGAILAKTAGLKVAHVEAGLRSFDFMHPFPEELIRVLIWKLRLADYLFCPNAWALRNVASYAGRKFDTGCNTLLDSLRMALESAPEDERPLPEEPYGIVSLHRFETLSSRDKLNEAAGIVTEIAEKVKLLFILHPPTLEALRRTGIFDVLDRNPKLELRPRYDYFRFVRLLSKSEFVVTDGGSNQEECFYLGHPCLILRYRTERREGLGQNAVLSRFDPAVIRHFLENYRSFAPGMPKLEVNPSGMILDSLRQHWN